MDGKGTTSLTLGENGSIEIFHEDNRGDKFSFILTKNSVENSGTENGMLFGQTRFLKAKDIIKEYFNNAVEFSDSNQNNCETGQISAEVSPSFLRTTKIAMNFLERIKNNSTPLPEHIIITSSKVSKFGGGDSWTICLHETTNGENATSFSVNNSGICINNTDDYETEDLIVNRLLFQLEEFLIKNKICNK